ncbi:MAG: hypothetical protein DWH81_08720 [Planctomycetota bacterium]|nr:MAG: hypothetical protein DWH81_08720 [Planctomycetota bacterium]
MNFPAIRSSTLLALFALALGVCALTEVQAQGLPGAGHTGSVMSRIDRAELQPAPHGHSVAQPGPSAHNDQITIDYQYAWRWKESGQEVFYARENCRVTQGSSVLEANEMVFWLNSTPSTDSQGTKDYRLTVYLDGEARLSEPDQTVSKPWMLVELRSSTPFQCSKEPQERSMADSQTYQRGLDRRRDSRNDLQQTQYSETVPEAPILPDGSIVPFGQSTSQQFAPRRVTITPRNLGSDFKVHSDVDRSKQPPESMTTIQGGVRIDVENVPLAINGQIYWTSIELSADRAVIWTSVQGLGNTGSGIELNENTPFQVYLEGDIVVRQGNSIAQASHAFYDLRDQRGLLMNSELRTEVPEYGVTLRLRADTIRQTSQTSFQAQNAWVSTSQMGRPGYRVQSGFITVEDRPNMWGNQVDPSTGQPSTSQYISATNNTLFIEEVPVFYLPRVSGPIEETPFPLESVSVGYSGMFGAELNTLWGVDKLFGFDLPEGVDWNLMVDGYTKRGPAVGTNGNYDVYGQLLGLPTHITGEGLVYYINDGGLDRLGLGRNSLTFPNANRGRALSRTRIEAPNGLTMSTELSYFFNNDRNFLEQYYEPEFDRGKDQENLVNLGVQNDNITGSLMFQVNPNEIFDQTEWLPRLDLTGLGEPLMNDYVSWSHHSWAGYGHIKPATPPTDPADTFTPLPYFPNVQGLVTGTRHEVTLPLQVGAVKVAPYALGEAAYWQQDINANDLSRLYGSAGLRASLEFWRAMPEIQSSILGLNGLAHKVVLDADYSYSRSSQSLSDIAQYNAFDEDAQERFRERFISLEYGGTLPPQFDPRFYAVRTGAGQSVTAAYQELVDNQQVLRLGLRQRWQTKDGPVERQRVKDWMSLDLEASVFPNATRDNFGSTLGLLTGRYMWHVGERTQFVANAVVDPFNQGQRVWNAGILTQRGPRGSLYFGFRQVEAQPVFSQLVTGSYSYRMSEKWISTFGASYDVAEGLDRGQSLTITRVGEYMLFHLGTGYDRSRNNYSLNVMVEPRLGGKSSLMQMMPMIGGGTY